MSVTTIVLLVIGIICIVISYILGARQEKKSVKEAEEARITAVDDTYELTDGEKRIIKSKISEAIADYADEIVVGTEDELSKCANEKMMALGDYAVTVCEEIENNHKEAMFLYSMLNDKQKEIISLVGEVDTAKKEYHQAVAAIKTEDVGKVSDKQVESQTDIKEAVNRIDIDKVQVPVAKKTAIEELTIEDIEEYDEDFRDIDSIDMDLEKEIESDIEDSENVNDIVLELHKSGMNIIEIAKQLGLGVGEVKLIVDLYQGE